MLLLLPRLGVPLRSGTPKHHDAVGGIVVLPGSPSAHKRTRLNSPAARWELAEITLCRHDIDGSNSREIRHARYVQDHLGKGLPEAAAIVAAEQDIRREEAAERAARRAAWVNAGMMAGLTRQEASVLYGAGPWCQELRAEQYLRLKQAGHLRLSAWATARAHHQMADFPFAGSQPRKSAWAKYAAQAFFGGLAADTSPTAGWRRIAREAGIGVVN